MTFSCKNCEGKQKLPEQLQRNATLEEERGSRGGEVGQSEAEEESGREDGEGMGEAKAELGPSRLWHF